MSGGFSGSYPFWESDFRPGLGCARSQLSPRLSAKEKTMFLNRNLKAAILIAALVMFSSTPFARGAETGGAIVGNCQEQVRRAGSRSHREGYARGPGPYGYRV